MKAFVVQATYRIEGKSAYVYLYGRQEDGKTFLTRNKTKAYFFIKKTDEEQAKITLQQATLPGKLSKTTRIDFHSNALLQVTCDTPKDIPNVRDALEGVGIDTYEADVRFAVRFLMDRGIQGSCEIIGAHAPNHSFVDCYYEEPTFAPVRWTPVLKTLAIDIETGDNGKLLYCISLAGSDGYRKVLMVSKTPVVGDNIETFPTQKACLEAFCQRVREHDPDIITGWSVIDFDLAQLSGFCEKHGVPFMIGRADDALRMRLDSSMFRDSTAEITGRVVLDGIMLLKASFVKLDDYKLATAAHEILGKEKLIAQTNKVEEIERQYREDKAALAAYCLLDSELVLEILAAKRILELTIERSLLTGLTMDRVRASIASLDSLYLRELSNRNIAARTHTYQEKEEQITGGYVMESVPGIYDYVIVCDFKSLYPSMMRTLNIDPLSYRQGMRLPASTDEFVVAENGAVFTNTAGILPELLDKLHEAREDAKKRKDPVATGAIKILMNSFFGALASPQCRFFSLEVANAITVSCQYILKSTVQLIRDQGHEVIYGDSVTAERPIVIRRQGLVDVLSISSLFLENGRHAKRRGSKEVIDLRALGIETITVDPSTGKSCFKLINEIVRHKTNKKVYRVHQKSGETRCTEDHSLITQVNGEFVETKPQELQNRPIATIQTVPLLKRIRRIDLKKLLESYECTAKYKGSLKTAKVQADDTHVWFGWTVRKKTIKLKRYITFPSPDADALLRLLGYYVSEGSSSTPETTDSRWGAAIAGDEATVHSVRRDYLKLFTNTTTTVIRSNAPGLRTLHYTTGQGEQITEYEDTTYKLNMMNQLAAVFFKQLCGQTSVAKRVPSFIFHLSKREQLLFLNAYISGDGSRKFDAKYSDEYKTHNYCCTTKSLLLVSGLSLLLKQQKQLFTVKYRPEKEAYTLVTCTQHNARSDTKITQDEYDGYVYDLNVADTHMFADGCGQLLLHNTDSIFIDLSVQNQTEAETIGHTIEAAINLHFKTAIKERYHRESKLELQFEKTFVRFYLPMTRGGESSKKRYAGMRIVDGKERIDFTGLEFVRRDWTELAKEFQLGILDRVFHDKPVIEFIKQFVADLKAGKLDGLLVYKKALRKDIDQYTKTTPQHVKAAMQMDTITSNIIEYVLTEEGPQPIEKQTSPIDYQHYIDKQLRPLADAVLFFERTNFDDVISGTSQRSLFEY